MGASSERLHSVGVHRDGRLLPPLQPSFPPLPREIRRFASHAPGSHGPQPHGDPGGIRQLAGRISPLFTDRGALLLRPGGAAERRSCAADGQRARRETPASRRPCAREPGPASGRAGRSCRATPPPRSSGTGAHAPPAGRLPGEPSSSPCHSSPGTPPSAGSRPGRRTASPVFFRSSPCGKDRHPGTRDSALAVPAPAAVAGRAASVLLAGDAGRMLISPTLRADIAQLVEQLIRNQ